MEPKSFGLTADQKKALRQRPTILLRVFAYAVSKGALGITSDEAERDLGLKHQSVSPRLNELVAAGILALNGKTRGTSGNTRGAKQASVYVVADGAAFGAYLRQPRQKKPQPGLTQADQAMLTAARTYVQERQRAKTEAGMKSAIARLLRALHNVQE